MTRAPRSASCRVQCGAEMACSTATTTMPSSGSTGSGALEDERGAHAATGAHGHDAQRRVPSAELPEHRHDHARAGRRDRVPEAAATAVDVDDAGVDAQLAGDRDRHGAERLVDLPRLDVADGELGLAEGAFDRADR